MNRNKPTSSCRFFPQGTCKFGKNCKWSHDQQRIKTESNVLHPHPHNNRQKTANRAGTKKSTCRQTDTVNNTAQGSSSRFAHTASIQQPPTTDNCPASGSIDRSKFIDKGKGKAISPPSLTVDRVIGGTLSATFGPGAAVLSLTPIAHNTSTIKITQLPANVTVTDIINLVSIIKPGLSPGDITISPPRNDSCMAIVRLGDVVLANSALEILSDADFQMRVLKVAAFKNKDESESSDRSEIVCSWWKESKTAILSCGGPLVRKAVIAKARDKEFKIAGKKIWVSTLERGLNALMVHGQVMHFPVQICDLDPAIRIEEMKTAFPECADAQFKEDGEQSVDSATVMRLLEYDVIGYDLSPAIRLFENFIGKQNNRQFASITFDSADNFKEAERKLAANTLITGQNYRNLGFQFAVNYNVSFSINKDVYKAISAEIKATEVEVRETLSHAVVPGQNTTTNSTTPSGKKTWKPTPFRVREQASQRQFVSVRINGVDRQAIVRMKNAVGILVRGYQLRDTEGGLIWDTALLGPEGRKLLDEVTVPLGVFAYCDSRNQRVTIHGARRACLEAELSLRDMHASIIKNTHQIPLTPLQRINCVLGVLEDIRLYLQGGEERAILNTDRTKTTLIVRCAEFQVEIIRGMVEKPSSRFGHRHRSKATDKGKQPADIELSDSDICPVCFCPPDQPAIRPPCEHPYCRECLANLLKNSTKFPLQCSAAGVNDATCDNPLPLHFLADFMPASDLTALLEKSFGEYVRQNPTLYRYCQTPECPSVYPVAAAGTTESNIPEFSCSQCFLNVCTACHGPVHRGETCLQRATHERAFNDWTAGNVNVKKCPRCEALIEKNEGCNRMECKCGAIFCWTCMGLFDRLEIYTHMEKCGGVFPGQQ